MFTETFENARMYEKVLKVLDHFLDVGFKALRSRLILSVFVCHHFVYITCISDPSISYLIDK